MALMVVVVCVAMWIITRHGYMLGLALSCLLAVVAGVTQVLPWLPSFGASIVLSNILYATAVMIGAESVLRRSALRIGMPWNVLYVAGVGAVVTYFYFVIPNFHARVYATHLPAGLLFLGVAYALRGLRRGPVWERVLFWAAVIYALEFFPRAILSSRHVPADTMSAFADPVYWQILQYSSTVVAAGFVLSVVVAALFDHVEDLRRDRDLDRLTGVLNRRGFEERTEALMRSQGTGCTLVLCDLDHFKRINDTYGHSMGDRVLGIVGGILRARAREQDLVGRIGGEEFAVMLPDGGTDEAGRLVSRLQEELAATRFPLPPDAAPIAASLGIAERTRGESLLALFDRADAALYRAKTGGRNRAVFDGVTPGERDGSVDGNCEPDAASLTTARPSASPNSRPS